MIPMNQQDYIKYANAFKSNYIKGNDLFKSMIQCESMGFELAHNQAAAATVFTNCLANKGNRRFIETLNNSGYSDTMLTAYLDGIYDFYYDEFDDLANNEDVLKDFADLEDVSALPFLYKGFNSLLDYYDLHYSYHNGYKNQDILNYLFNNTEATYTSNPLSSEFFRIWGGTYVPSQQAWYLCGHNADSRSSTITGRIYKLTKQGTLLIAATVNGYDVYDIEYNKNDNCVYAILCEAGTVGEDSANRNASPANYVIRKYKVTSTGLQNNTTNLATFERVALYHISYSVPRQCMLVFGWAFSNGKMNGDYFDEQDNKGILVIKNVSSSWTYQKYCYWKDGSPSSVIRNVIYDNEAENYYIVPSDKSIFVYDNSDEIHEVSLGAGYEFAIGGACFGDRKLLLCLTSAKSNFVKVVIDSSNESATCTAYTHNCDCNSMVYFPSYNMIALPNSTANKVSVYDNGLLDCGVADYGNMRNDNTNVYLFRLLITSPFTDSSIAIKLRSSGSYAQNCTDKGKIKIINVNRNNW